MQIQHTERDGLPGLTWNDMQVTPVSARAIYFALAGITLAVVVFFGGMMIVPGTSGSSLVPVFILAVMLPAPLFAYALVRSFTDSLNTITGPGSDPAQFKKLFSSNKANVTRGSGGRLCFEISRDDGMNAFFALEELKSFAIQSWEEYAEPLSPQWPRMLVLIADLGDGNAQLVARHCGPKNELTALLHQFNRTFIKDRPGWPTPSAPAASGRRSTPQATSLSDDVI